MVRITIKSELTGWTPKVSELEITKTEDGYLDSTGRLIPDEYIEELLEAVAVGGGGFLGEGGLPTDYADCYDREAVHNSAEPWGGGAKEQSPPEAGYYAD